MSAGLLLGIGLTTAASLSPKGVEPVRNVVMQVKLPLQRLARKAERWIEAELASAQEVEELRTENEALREEITRLEWEVLQGAKDSRENQRLRELLGLREKHSDFSFAEVTVVCRGGSDWQDVLTLSGEMEQVQPGDCVITAGGALAGVVQEVGTGWCTAITPLDPSFSMGVTVGAEERSAAARGTLGGLATGCLTLEYLTEADNLLPRTLVLTAGGTGSYPAGLVVGRVAKLTDDENGLTRTGQVTPEANLEEVTHLYVVVAFQGEEEP